MQQKQPTFSSDMGRLSTRWDESMINGRVFDNTVAYLIVASARIVMLCRLVTC